MTRSAPGLWHLGGLSPRELVRRVWNGMWTHDLWGSAAQLSYYFLLALFPFIICLLSVVALVKRNDLTSPLLETLEDIMPEQAYVLVQAEISRVLQSSTGKLLTLSTLGTIWAASSGMVSLMGALDRIFDASDRRGFIHMRITAIVLTLFLVMMLVTGSVLVTIGDRIADLLASMLELDLITAITGVTLNYLLGLGLLVTALEIAYYFGPDDETRGWHWITPGSVTGVILFTISSWGFSAYLRYNNTYSITYGSIGAVIVLMLWLYLFGLAILMGAEVNAAIHGAMRRPATTPSTKRAKRKRRAA